MNPVDFIDLNLETESSPFADSNPMRNSDHSLRHDIVVLADVGMRIPLQLNQFPESPTMEQITLTLRELLQEKIEQHGDWRPLQGAWDSAVKMLAKRTLQRFEIE